MSFLKNRRLAAFVVATIGLALSASTASAQSVIFTGKVTAAGAPLGASSVGIPELGVGAVTSIDGKYTFTVDIARTRGRTVNVVARSIGYRPKQLQVVLEAGKIEKDFDLEKDVLNLDQVVVTGVSGATSQKKTAFAVTVVDASQLRETPGTSPIASLSGKIAGASVVTVSGQPGSAPAIRLRAPTSITGRTDPLIIVDGTISRLSLADIASEDIERVEVLKGAAASSLYGSDAANGVVQIFTKRGSNLAEGQTSVTFRNEYGSISLPRHVPGNQSNGYNLNPDGSFALNAAGNRVLKADRISDNPYPVYYDQLNQVFKPGAFYTNYLSVGQRSGPTNFNASVQNTHETGVLDLMSGFTRQNFRVNVDHALSDRLDVSTGAFYGRSIADQAEDTGIFFGMRFLEPNINLLAPNLDGTPYNAIIKQPPQSGNLNNPLYGLSQRQISQARDRFTGTVKLRYRPLTWLTAEGNFNYDVANQNYKSLRPLGFINSAGGKDKGALFQSASNNRTYNTGFTLTSVRDFSWFTNTTKIAYVYEDQADNRVSVQATALTVRGVPEFAAYSPDPLTPVFPGSRSELLRAKNSFLVSTFEFKERYILDGVIRRDESSLFGSRERSQVYSRLSAAYRVTEDVTIPGVDELKIRASTGTAGLRPQFDAQYQTLAITGGSPQKVRLGNADLKPAFSRETEFGFNINFLRNYTLEYSYSDKVTKDQILDVPLSSAAGFTSQWQNAGTLSGSSHEIAFGALLLATRDYSWKFNVAGDRTRSKITGLNVQPFLNGPDGNTQFFRVAAGETFGVIYGEKWIKTAAQLAGSLANGLGGVGAVAANYKQNVEGFYVIAANEGTVSERPLKEIVAPGNVTLQQIGDVNPDFNLSFNNSVQWKSVSVNALVNWVHGGNIYNLTRQWPFNEERDPVFDQRGKAQADKKPIPYYQVFYNGINANDYFVEDGSYIRLRELSVNVQLPSLWVKQLHLGSIETARLGIVGRNLWTSTDYTGYDPDVSGGAGKPFAFRVDNFSYPAARTFTLMLELGY